MLNFLLQGEKRSKMCNWVRVVVMVILKRWVQFRQEGGCVS